MSASAQSSSSTDASGQILLRPHWEPGKLYTQETVTDTTATAPGKAVEQKMAVRQTTEIKVVPGQGPRGEKAAEVLFKAITGEIDAQGQKFTFDSSRMQEAHPMLRETLGSSVGQKFALLYDTEDRFIDVQGVEQLATQPGQAAGLSALAEARNLALLFRKSQEIGLPERRVAKGDAWTANEVLAFPRAGDMKVALKCKLSELVEREGRPHAKVEFEGSIQSAEPEKALGTEMSLRVNPESRMSGQVFFDLERRTVSLSVFLATIVLEREGQKVPIRQQVTTKLVSVQDATR